MNIEATPRAVNAALTTKSVYVDYNDPVIGPTRKRVMRIRKNKGQLQIKSVDFGHWWITVYDAKFESQS